MAARLLTNADIVALLAAGPPRLAAATAPLTPAQLRAAPAPDTWPITAILAHLRACADMWGGAIAQIIAHDHPTIKAVNPRQWIRSTDYLEQDVQPALDAFTAQRAELLAALAACAPADWERAATVTGAGKALERTVRFYAKWLAIHERSHVTSLERMALTLAQGEGGAPM